MIYRFGRFTFDFSGGLAESGAPVPLAPDARILLSFLIAHRDRVVSHRELSKAIWKGRFDPEALDRVVGQTRDALGDDRDAPIIIRAYPGLGFQFAAPVETDGPPAAARPNGRLPEREKMPLRFIVIALAVMIGALYGAIELVDKPSQETAPGVQSH